ncbi:ABC transporter ATP-binding protein [Mesorhizobium sp. L48C026A00]|uniref:ABC transporter ATP-binding protein n=1 Tax=Mesorhizobium sp. L48C026A00 TaxID=1287182 RepID=UPI0003D05E42|nr:ABC transporter ATP-binding protein [Mesorhizobium sp. L48C026A00]ESZ11260.1 nickel ABC transporter ATPase [Mesorhizobium sp. L48C026A00]
MNDDKPIYAIENLIIDLYATSVSVRAVDGVSFSVRPGETVAVVGESGSGKTVMTLGPLGLLPEGVTVAMRGTAQADGSDLIGMGSRQLSELRGRYFGVIFQDPMSALNPMLKIGPQLARQARRFAGLSHEPARRQAVSLLARLGIPDPEDRYHRYPHEMSGGMLQRAMIALALAARPRVLIADEPTTALDATVQAQILELIRQIQREEGIAVVLVTHDIGVVASVADRVIVLYAGQVAEEGTAMDVLTRPVHPYTRGLLASVPDFRSDERATTREIPGLPPSQIRLEPGCRFADRCELVEPGCRKHRPPLQTISVSANPHRVACPVVIRREGIALHV